MLYMKGDDMDAILRKAAENYEVDADAAADWDAVHAALHEPDEKAPLAKEKKRRFVFWWLFLIPLGWIAHTEYNKFYTGNAKTNNSSVSSVKTKPDIDKANSQQSSTTETNNSSNKKEIVTRPAITNSTTFLHKQNSFATSHKLETRKTNNSSLINYSNNNSVSDNNIINNSLLPQKQQIQQALPQIQNTDQKELANSKQQKSGEPIIQLPVTSNQQNNSPVITQNQNKQQNSVAGTSVSKSLSTKKQKSNANYFYTGLMAGGDLSSIKYQQTKPVGFNAGLLVGYKFNKLSIESGFFVDKKNYFTKGEYFDKRKISFLRDAEVLTADGYCKMFEIPLNVKYDFSTHANHTWFATAGLSSYLMHKEYYNYAYIKNGQEYHGAAPYFNTTKDWFSVLNISAGYQLQTGNKTNVRIEPYYKMPLSGMGTANLHITSVGINLGITRRIP